MTDSGIRGYPSSHEEAKSLQATEARKALGLPPLPEMSSPQARAQAIRDANDRFVAAMKAAEIDIANQEAPNVQRPRTYDRDKEE